MHKNGVCTFSSEAWRVFSDWSRPLSSSSNCLTWLLVWAGGEGMSGQRSHMPKHKWERMGRYGFKMESSNEITRTHARTLLSRRQREITVMTEHSYCHAKWGIFSHCQNNEFGVKGHSGNAGRNYAKEDGMCGLNWNLCELWSCICD